MQINFVLLGFAEYSLNPKDFMLCLFYASPFQLHESSFISSVEDAM